MSNGAHWHAIPLNEAIGKLGTSRDGLTTGEAAKRLEQYGPNRLPEKPPRSFWYVCLLQFRSPLIYVLAAAAVLSIVVGEETDAAFIGLVLLLNAFIGGYQEWRAEQRSQALKKLLQIKALVERNGDVSDIDAELVVPGDVVWLESGRRVPADLRLIAAHGLEIDESLLTGESLPVNKDLEWQGSPEVQVADQKNMAFAGSIITRGRGAGVAVATGSATGVGRLALEVIGAEGGKPPLVERMERFSRVIAVVVLLGAAFVSAAGVLMGRYEVTEMFFFAVALAVSAIPEGLPISMTVALAVATTRMARRAVIVRKLTAVEGLGSCTMIATDKTGTLTCNELTVREFHLPGGESFHLTGEGFRPEGQVMRDGTPVEPGETSLEAIVRAGVLCNEASLHRRDGEWTWHGDSVDLALLSAGVKYGAGKEHLLERYPQVAEIPFEPEHRYAATFHSDGGRTLVCVKGAPERILEMSGLGPGEHRQAMDLAEALARKGFRILALAEGELPGPIDPKEAPPQPEGLRFLGFAAMIDPLRPEAGPAVREARQAGVAAIMVTGDHPSTALAISRELGLAESEDQVVTGSELAKRTPEELRQILNRATVMARVTPEQKLQIVVAARASGHFVAVTGDGVNDAPALRAANIGVAMGRSGTDVAREAADLVVSDDNFASIVAGIEEGRVAYSNLRKVIYLLISTGAAELIMVGLALLSGLPLPLLPAQILWLNLVTNGIQDKALAFEPNEGDVLKRKPRDPGEPIFNRLMIERTVIGAGVMATVAFIAFWWMLENGWEETSARNYLLLLMVLFENVHIGNCRSETKSLFLHSPFRSPLLLAGAVLAFLVHLAAMHIPLGQQVLRIEPIPLEHGVWLLALALTVLPAIEIHKWLWGRRAAA